MPVPLDHYSVDFSLPHPHALVPHPCVLNIHTPPPYHFPLTPCSYLPLAPDTAGTSTVLQPTNTWSYCPSPHHRTPASPMQDPRTNPRPSRVPHYPAVATFPALTVLWCLWGGQLLPVGVERLGSGLRTGLQPPCALRVAPDTCHSVAYGPPATPPHDILPGFLDSPCYSFPLDNYL